MKLEENTWKVIMLAFGFLLLFMSFNTLQQLTTEIYQAIDEPHLGFYLLSIIYSFLVLFSFASSAIVIFLRPKFGFTIGGLGYFENAMCAEAMIYLVTMLAAAAVGITGSIIWVYQPAYIAKAALNNNESTFQGLFFSITQMSTIIGNTIAGTIISDKDSYSLFLILLSISAAIGLVIFSLLPSPTKKKSENVLIEIQNHEEEKDEILLEDMNVGEDEEKLLKKIRLKLITTVKMMISQRMLPVLTLFTYIGMQQAILYSILPLFLKQKMNSSKNDYSDYDIYRTSSEMLIAVGIGECLGSLTSGKLTEIKGKKFGVLLVLIFGVLACVSGLICDQISEEFYFWGWAGNGWIWGLQNSVAMTVATSLAIGEFSGKVEALAVFVVCRSTSSFLIFLIFGILKNIYINSLVVIPILAAYTIVATGITIFFFGFKPRRTNSILN